MDSMDNTQRKAVDWSKPIEAVHVDGRVVEVRYAEYDCEDDAMSRRVEGVPSFGVEWFGEDGSHRHKQWTIRNAQTPKAPAIDPALFERMVGLVRGMREATKDNYTGKYAVAHNAYREARDIMDVIEPEVPEKIDEDLLTAREIALRYSLPAQLSSLSSYNTNQGKFDDHQVMHALQAAIRRGRALERGE